MSTFGLPLVAEGPQWAPPGNGHNESGSAPLPLRTTRIPPTLTLLFDAFKLPPPCVFGSPLTLIGWLFTNTLELFDAVVVAPQLRESPCL